MGPLTIPGGTSSSFLPSLPFSAVSPLEEEELPDEFDEECFDDKSTGWLLLVVVDMVLLFTFDNEEVGDGNKGSLLMSIKGLV